MRKLLVILTFALIFSCSRDREFDKLEVVAYRWMSKSLESDEIIPYCRFYATIDNNSKCVILNNLQYKESKICKISHYGKVDIDLKKIEEILARFKTIKKDTNLLKENSISGPESDLNYILHYKNQIKIIYIREDNYNSVDSCFIDFYNYMYSICKNRNYAPLSDTLEIYYEYQNIINQINNGTLLNFPPLVEKIENTSSIHN